MIQSVASFLAGYACRSQCGPLPCGLRPKNPNGERPFKLTVLVHSTSTSDICGPGLVQDQRPCVVLKSGVKTKECGKLCFKETITLEVTLTDELALEVICSTKYEFWVASVSVNSREIGEASFPVFAVLPRLKAEDRDADGIIYATPVIPFDVMHEGRVTARVYLSFETNQAPPP